jgi:excisionase family DNA binding protein
VSVPRSDDRAAEGTVPTREPSSPGGGPRGMDERLLTVAEVAERLACSRTLVRRLGNQGVLQRIKVRRLLRFRESDVARLMAGGAPSRSRPPRGRPKQGGRRESAS